MTPLGIPPNSSQSCYDKWRKLFRMLQKTFMYSLDARLIHIYCKQKAFNWLNVISLSRRATQIHFPEDPLKITHGKGPYLYDENGVQYLDCMNNVAHGMCLSLWWLLCLCVLRPGTAPFVEFLTRNKLQSEWNEKWKQNIVTQQKVKKKMGSKELTCLNQGGRHEEFLMIPKVVILLLAESFLVFDVMPEINSSSHPWFYLQIFS